MLHLARSDPDRHVQNLEIQGFHISLLAGLANSRRRRPKPARTALWPGSSPASLPSTTPWLQEFSYIISISAMLVSVVQNSIVPFELGYSRAQM